MTECPEPGARALTLSDVPDSLLAEYGFHRGGAPAMSYTCSEPAAVLVPIGEVSGPDGRKLNEEWVRSLLRGIRDGAELPPIVVVRHPGAPRAQLVNGAHRLHVSAALRFPMIPCLHLSRDEADAYGLPSSPGMVQGSI
jgi:hypothetical protein